MFVELADSLAAAAAYVVVAGILASSAEEMFIDLQYVVRGLALRERRVIGLAELDATPALDIAVVVTAGRDAGLVDAIEKAVVDINYDPRRFDIFCATQHGDLETQRRLDDLADQFPNIHKVMVAETAKLTALRGLYQVLLLEEHARGKRFDLVLVHDAGDAIHPRSLELCARLIGDRDVVQLPTLGLAPARRSPVSGALADALCERQTRELAVRQAIAGAVSITGSGSAFARGAFAAIAGRRGPRARFRGDPGELPTAGLDAGFLCRSIERPPRPGRLRSGAREELIATRRPLPGRLMAAIRSRGADIARAARHGAGGRGERGVARRYVAWRDRKPVVDGLLALGAHALIAYAAGRALIGAVGAPSLTVATGPALRWLLGLALVLLAWRAAVRTYLVRRTEGPARALACPPRMILASLIDGLATATAIAGALGRLLARRPARPGRETAGDDAGADRQRLGELLVERAAVSRDDIDEALNLQQRTDLRLGEILSASGMVSRREIVRSLGDQLTARPLELAPFDIPRSLLHELPEPIAAAHQTVPVAIDGGRPLVAMADLPEGAQLDQLSYYFGVRPAVGIAPAAAIRRARWRAYRRLVLGAGSRPRTGARLVALGAISEATLDTALVEQRETGERLGDLLLRRRLIAPAQLSAALPESFPPHVAVRAEAIDIEALRAIGYGLAVLYLLAPLRGSRVTLASPFLIHRDVADEVKRRLDGRPVEIALAAILDTEVALALAAQKAWPGRAHLDSAEIATLRADPELSSRVIDIATLSRLLRRSPLDALEANFSIERDRLAALRARSLGLPVAARYGVVRGGLPLVPPELASEFKIRTERSDRGGITLAAPRPSPRLAHQVAELFCDHAVSWTVYPDLNPQRGVST